MTITPEAPATKKCSRCETLKPVIEFRPHATSADGLSYTCRTCLNAINRLSRARRNGKRCASCGEKKKLREYPVNPLREDGRGSWCTDCHTAAGRRTRAAIEQRRAPEREPEPAPEAVNVGWWTDAACRDEDTELFFPIGSTHAALAQTENAKAVCRECPVMETCLAYALETGQEAGVFGGLSEDERRALKRKAARNRARASA